MIIQYDTKPGATIDEKLRSLIKSIQLAFDEIGIIENSSTASQSNNNTALAASIQQLNEQINTLSAAIEGANSNISTLSGAVSALEGKLPDAPDTDGAYRLTVTVTDGTPEYTWELA